MRDALDLFLAEMAHVFAGEGRDDATETADALRGLGARPPFRPESCRNGAAIRRLAAASPLPVAAAAARAHDSLGWADDPVALSPRDRARDLPFSVANLLGPDGIYFSGRLRAGLYYQRPRSRYGLHSHAAVETYAIIAGAAYWTAGDTQCGLGPGDFVHHSTYLPHACETGDEGVIALWRWSGDIATDSYRVHDGRGAFSVQPRDRNPARGENRF